MQKTLGPKIHELRTGKKLSLRNLGELLKDKTTNTPVSAAYLSDIENSRRFPSDEMIEKLATVLGIPTKKLEEHDPRRAERELGELIRMNPQFAFAFQKVIKMVKEQDISPTELLRRIQNPASNPA